ncbi:MAG: modified peptide precursor CbpA [Magnetococcales bacterium]|nr:modified peptide precursor CbpA [Magnetococcales bacterium]
MSLNQTPTQQTSMQQHPTTPPGRIVDEVIAQRKSCSADGIGLSHYILMDRKDK